MPKFLAVFEQLRAEPMKLMEIGGSRLIICRVPRTRSCVLAALIFSPFLEYHLERRLKLSSIEEII